MTRAYIFFIRNMKVFFKSSRLLLISHWLEVCYIGRRDLNVLCHSLQLLDFMHLWWTALSMLPVTGFLWYLSACLPQECFRSCGSNGGEGLNNCLVLQRLRLSSSSQGVSLLSYSPFHCFCLSTAHSFCSLLLGIIPFKRLSKRSLREPFP